MWLMNSSTLIILLVLVLGMTTLAYLLLKKFEELQQNQKQDTALLEIFRSMQKSIDETKDTMNRSLLDNNKYLTSVVQTSTKDIHERLTRAAEVIGELKKEAGQFTEISRSMKDLQEFLQSPKLRGNIGESVLKDLITQMFPKNSFHLQYSFKSGERVDAAIQTEAGILPIDSKFPMENFQKMVKCTNDGERLTFKKVFIRDIKKHVSDISKKYILPEENTLDFALMYIPSESVYYEVVNEDGLMDFARSSRVYPVSPTTLYANLQTILLSFEGKKIEHKAKEIFKLLRALEKDYNKSFSSLSVLGTHLTNAYNKYTEFQNSFTLIGQKLSSNKLIAGDGLDPDPDKIIKG